MVQVVLLCLRVTHYGTELAPTQRCFVVPETDALTAGTR
jgi:hypothetical protein